MTLRLRLWKDGDPASALDRPFEQEVVNIGRDPSNALQLEKPNVSKHHASIEQTGDRLLLTDLKSRNGTYLNGTRVPPEDPREIKPGDKVRICDFIVEVVAWDRPVSSGSESSEGEQKVETRAPLLPVDDSIDQPATADKSIIEELEQRFDAAERECGRLREQMALDATIADENVKRLKEEVLKLSQELSARAAAAPMPVRALDESTGLRRLKAMLEIILQPVLKIMRGRILFRSEFTGATMFQHPKMEALSRQNSDEWIRFFLDAELSEPAARDRLDLLSAEIDEIIPHVMGLLDGYRKSIDVGTKNMLAQLHPGRLREELFKKPLQLGPLSIPYRFLPLLADRIAWKAIVQRHREMEEEDRGNLEQRFFRPAFIQGYINCLSSAKHDSLQSRSNIPTSTKAQP